MQFALLILQLLPVLPGLIRAVESIYGAGNGTAKLTAAVNILQAVVPAVADHLAAEPTNTPKLQSLIGTVVAGLNAANTWSAPPILGIPQQPNA